MTLRTTVRLETDYGGDPKLLKLAANTTLRAAGQAEAELTVVLADDALLRELNLRYLGIDEPTDVLSFPAGEGASERSESYYLGDVVIGLPVAKRQASAGGHSVEAELALLTVHGVLHLLGHDHADDDGRRRMWAIQKKVLGELGYVEVAPITK